MPKVLIVDSAWILANHKAHCIILCLVAVASLSLISKAQSHVPVDSYGNLALGFEANQGQTDTRVKFLSRGSDYVVFLTDKGSWRFARVSQG
jgi:hypothetical protein